MADLLPNTVLDLLFKQGFQFRYVVRSMSETAFGLKDQHMLALGCFPEPSERPYLVRDLAANFAIDGSHCARLCQQLAQLGMLELHKQKNPDVNSARLSGYTRTQLGHDHWEQRQDAFTDLDRKIAQCFPETLTFEAFLALEDLSHTYCRKVRGRDPYTRNFLRALPASGFLRVMTLQGLITSIYRHREERLKSVAGMPLIWVIIARYLSLNGAAIARDIGYVTGGSKTSQAKLVTNMADAGLLQPSTSYCYERAGQKGGQFYKPWELDPEFAEKFRGIWTDVEAEELKFKELRAKTKIDETLLEATRTLTQNVKALAAEVRF